MSIDTSLAEPMASILDTFAGVNALRKLEVESPEPERDEQADDLTEFFERFAETHDDHSWIRVDTLVCLVLDNTELAALIRAATPTGRSNDAHRTRAHE